MSTADAVDREVAWLQAYGDGLPALLASAGGPFGLVQGYWARTPGKRVGGQLYVMRESFTERRLANQKRMSTYDFVLKLVWPLASGTGNAETEQRDFDVAIDLVLQRIGGYLGDKTHGGRFLSVAEVPKWVAIHYEDPQSTVPPEAEFRAQVHYSADDFEISG